MKEEDGEVKLLSSSASLIVSSCRLAELEMGEREFSRVSGE
jgi:hypothetical protein